MTAQEISYDILFNLFLTSINIPRQKLSENTLSDFCPIHEIVISPAQIVFSKSTISNKVYWENVLLLYLLLYF